MLKRLTDHPVTFWAAVVFVALMGLAIATDLYLVFNGYPSISWRTWTAESLHPTLIAAGCVFGCGICYILRGYWYLCSFNGIMIGHLFVHF